MSLLSRIREYLTRQHVPPVPTAPVFARSCTWCQKPLDPARPNADWWTAKYCSKECGDKTHDAENARERQLADAMDSAHDRFEKL